MVDQPTASRLRRRRLVMRIVNVPMRRLLGLPFPTPLSDRLMLVHLTGRKTGRRYCQPVSYVIDGDVLLTPGGGRWTRNLRDGQPVTLRLRGRDRTGTPELVRDRRSVEPLLALLLAANPRARSFMPFADRDGEIVAPALDAALAHGFCVVRWHLDRSTHGR